MYNTTRTESFLTATPADRPREGVELSLACANHLCTVALLLARQDQGMTPRELQDVASLVREVATLSVAAHL